jgi:hypothetical protein
MKYKAYIWLGNVRWEVQLEDNNDTREAATDAAREIADSVGGELGSIVGEYDE